jgi:hypothetical protein
MNSGATTSLERRYFILKCEEAGFSCLWRALAGRGGAPLKPKMIPKEGTLLNLYCHEKCCV